MGRSQRANRGPARYREDQLGDKHYPGYGSPARGEVINPALKPGDHAGYLYDWAYTWPSGSGAGSARPANGSDTYGGLTLTNAGLPANAGGITASGSVDEPLQIGVLLFADAAALQGGVGGVTQVPQGATLDEVATAVSDLLASLDAILSTPSGAVASYNLQSAGTINLAFIQIGPGTGGAAQQDLPAPTPPPLEPEGVAGPISSDYGVNFWLSRSGGLGTIWYYWIDVDNAPGADTKRNLSEFLADGNIIQEYRDDVQARAELLGWSA